MNTALTSEDRARFALDVNLGRKTPANRFERRIIEREERRLARQQRRARRRAERALAAYKKEEEK